jgi:hypothetical protein
MGAPVLETVDALILDLLEWMGPNRRPYAEVLELARLCVRGGGGASAQAPPAAAG